MSSLEAATGGSDNGGISALEMIMETRLFFERRIREAQERATRAAASFDRHLQMTRDVARQTYESQEQLDQLIEEFRKRQAELSKALSIKTRNEIKLNYLKEDLAKRSEEFEKTEKLLSDKKKKNNEFASIIQSVMSDLEAHEEKISELDKKAIDKAIAWYQDVLGLKIVGGDAVKFTLTKIDPSNPEKEYSFSLKFENDKFCLLKCDPFVEGTNNLLRELNKTNDWLPFLCAMREKFASFKPTDATCISSATSSSPVMTSSPVTPHPSPAQRTRGRPKKDLATPSSSLRRSSRLRVPGSP